MFVCYQSQHQPHPASQPGSQASGFRHGWLGLRPGWLGLRAGMMAQRGGTDGRTDERTNERTENLPILQDFVPYRGRCPASPHENQGESRAGQGNRWPFDAFGLLINPCLYSPNHTFYITFLYGFLYCFTVILYCTFLCILFGQKICSCQIFCSKSVFS